MAEVPDLVQQAHLSYAPLSVDTTIAYQQGMRLHVALPSGSHGQPLASFFANHAASCGTAKLVRRRHTSIPSAGQAWRQHQTER
jgi:hypothetical protein